MYSSITCTGFLGSFTNFLRTGTARFCKRVCVVDSESATFTPGEMSKFASLVLFALSFRVFFLRALSFTVLFVLEERVLFAGKVSFSLDESPVSAGRVPIRRRHFCRKTGLLVISKPGLSSMSLDIFRWLKLSKPAMVSPRHRFRH